MATDFSKYGIPITTNNTNNGGVTDFSKYGSVSTEITPNQVSQSSVGNVLFPAKTSFSDSPITAGLKSIGNVPGSALNRARNLGTALLNPVDTAKGIANTLIGAEQTGLNKLTGQNIQTSATQTFESVLQALNNRYGSLEKAQQTAINDPVGFGADVASIIGGGASLIGKGAEVANLGSKVAGLVTNPLEKTVTGTANLASETAKFGVSQATGLNKDTISLLL